jgi:hypothetical protein
MFEAKICTAKSPSTTFKEILLIPSIDVNCSNEHVAFILEQKSTRMQVLLSLLVRYYKISCTLLNFCSRMNKRCFFDQFLGKWTKSSKAIVDTVLVSYLYRIIYLVATFIYVPITIH